MDNNYIDRNNNSTKQHSNWWYVILIPIGIALLVLAYLQLAGIWYIEGYGEPIENPAFPHTDFNPGFPPGYMIPQSRVPLRFILGGISLLFGGVLAFSPVIAYLQNKREGHRK